MTNLKTYQIFRYFEHHAMARLFSYFMIAMAILNMRRIVQWTCDIDNANLGILAIYAILVIVYERVLANSNKSNALLPIVDINPLAALIDDQPTLNDKLERSKYVSLLGRKIISTYVTTTNN